MTLPHRPSGKYTRLAPLAALLLAACGSVPQQSLYTLRSEVAAPPPAAAVGLSVVVGPVTIPPLFDRPEWVVQDGANQLRVLNQQLWAQPLAADIAQALAGNLNRQLGEVAFADGANWPVPPRLRVQVDMQRFESRLAPSASISDQYRWAVSCAAGARPLAIRSGLSTVAQAASTVDGRASPYAALARAHAAGLQQASEEIAAALRELNGSCGTP